ncbi:aryl-alcohol dehydrogenase-like predicted oxidoreductase [Paenibacillus taihuensis]|uniref:Aryl-alcohol dehydrogenase-like predicted oxidoreductase n=1 Tax=Paenibacillus taihuensis TaxID=1156355 RepID=A0A3D9RZ72_9BACL|nr:aldo/keto reductase [Paenibacillus taihuensis]REE85167.1 aryl-alcohol dehydrogenase-like predicted oxidoreductase [Paenibacillus taihuensis]
MPNVTKLGLGGHSFIEELGNDPMASFEEQCAIVGACLDSGIQLIDTTYYQERVALGKVLQALSRRNEAEIMAWNFFNLPGQSDKLVGFSRYEPHHIDVMLQELQTDRIDVLVIHTHDDEHRLRQEMDLAKRWMDHGKVGTIGLGMVEPSHLDRLPADHPVTHVLAPYNIAHQRTQETFVIAKEMGLTTVALSPFVRGWKLDEIESDQAADLLLRWVTEQEIVDKVIVSMRKQEWIHSNLQAARRGRLSDEEKRLINEWA